MRRPSQTVFLGTPENLSCWGDAGYSLPGSKLLAILFRVGSQCPGIYSFSPDQVSPGPLGLTCTPPAWQQTEVRVLGQVLSLSGLCIIHFQEAGGLQTVGDLQSQGSS